VRLSKYKVKQLVFWPTELKEGDVDQSEHLWNEQTGMRNDN
jgi:hypothetical protein